MMEWWNGGMVCRRGVDLLGGWGSEGGVMEWWSEKRRPERTAVEVYGGSSMIVGSLNNAAVVRNLSCASWYATEGRAASLTISESRKSSWKSSNGDLNRSSTRLRIKKFQIPFESFNTIPFLLQIPNPVRLCSSRIVQEFDPPIESFENMFVAVRRHEMTPTNSRQTVSSNHNNSLSTEEHRAFGCYATARN